MNQNLSLKIFVFTFLVLFALSANGQKLSYPNARQVEQTDDFQGVKIADPYRWMEDENSPELKSWIKEQDYLLKTVVETVPARLSIQKRISDLVTFDSFTTQTTFMTPFVYKRNFRYFFLKVLAGTSKPILYVKDGLNAKPKILLDITALNRDEDWNLHGYQPSWDGKYVALFVSEKNARWLTLKILDVNTGKELPDVLTDLRRASSLSWTPDSRGFFYTKFEKIDQGPGKIPNPGGRKIFFHTLGTPQSNDELVFEQTEKPTIIYSYQVTADGKYLVIETVEGSSSQNRVYLKDLSQVGEKVKPLLSMEDATYTFLGNQGSDFWFYTNLNAPRGRVIKINVTQSEDRSSWQEIVPQAKEVISGGSSVGGNAIGMFGDRIVLLYMLDSNPFIKIFNLQGKLEKTVNLPKGGTIWNGFSGTQNDNEIFFQYLQLTSPATFYRLHLKTKETTTFLRPKVNLESTDYEIKQVFYTSQDGTRVPMFITHRKGLKLDGSNPTYMYGYGAFSWVAFIFYQPHILAWLDMGGVYAIPGIRGGGEYGEDWHQAGIKQYKKNTVDDYISAAEWLIKNKYTSSSKLVANGSSASSAVTAAAMLQRPELFGAAVIDIPVLDMLRFHKFTNGAYWTPEFGSPENPHELKFLLAYSPYHNIKKGQCYPPMMIKVGEQDQTALPLHGFKFTAQMQNSQNCHNPVLLKMMWGAGHNAGATPEQRINSWTDELTFLSKVLRITN